MKTTALLALAVLAAGWAAPARAYDDQRMGIHPSQDRGETPGDFRHWADGKVHRLRGDFDRLDKRLDAYGTKTREDYKDEVSNLKERVAKLEGRLQEVGDRSDRGAWKTRAAIRDELKDIRGDLGGLRRKLDKK